MAPAAGRPVILSVTVPVTRQPVGSVMTTSAGGETEDPIIQAIEVVFRSWRFETRERVAAVGIRDRLGNLHRRRRSPFHPIEPNRDSSQGRPVGVIEAASADTVSVCLRLLLR